MSDPKRRGERGGYVAEQSGPERPSGKVDEPLEGSPRTLDRRGALQLGAGFAAFTAGCAGKATSGERPTKGAPGGALGERVAPQSAADELRATDAPLADAAPLPLGASELLAGIDTIVVLMMENRSFDHYFGRLFSDAFYPAAGRVNGLRGTERNSDSAGSPVTVFRLDDFAPPDLPHGWEESRTQFNGGKNDGFVRAHAGPSERETMGFHDRSQLPFSYWLADNFTICDTWHSSVLGPTWPNRYYLHAASANGQRVNLPFNAGPLKTVWEALSNKGVTAKNYYAGSLAWYAGAFPGKLLSGQNPLASIDTFFQDAAKGELPSFSIIDPDFSATDDHPSHDVRKGQAFIASLYHAIAASPQWSRCLFLITYDEHGGFFDHVPPPACEDDDPDFRQLGFRVPAVAIGPTVRRGQVVSTLFDHASVAATLATRFGIESLSARASAANDLSSVIEPARVKDPLPPPPAPPPVVVPQALAWLRATSESSQPTLEQMDRDGAIPSHARDARSREERLGAWLDRAEALGAVRRE